MLIRPIDFQAMKGIGKLVYAQLSDLIAFFSTKLNVESVIFITELIYQ